MTAPNLAAFRLTPLILLACTLSVALTYANQAPAQVTAQARVELELITDRNVSPNLMRQWSETLSAAGVSSVRMRAGSSEETPALKTTGTGSSTTHRVVGVLTADGQLRVPGKRLSPRNQAEITAWLKTLQAEGDSGLQRSEMAYGLTEDQLETVIRDLSTPLPFSTKGQTPTQILERLESHLRYALRYEPGLKAKLAAAPELVDEFEGLSSGTALAATLNSVGITLIPRKELGREIEYLLTASPGSQRTWPIGWPAEKSGGQMVPKSLESLTIELEGISARRALDALQQRLEVPFVYDYQALQQHEIDLNSKNVSIPNRRMLYGRVIDQVLFQARCKKEFLMDEAGKPFILITPIARNRS